jgi:hypothetical protein
MDLEIPAGDAHRKSLWTATEGLGWLAFIQVGLLVLNLLLSIVYVEISCVHAVDYPRMHCLRTKVNIVRLESPRYLICERSIQPLSEI